MFSRFCRPDMVKVGFIRKHMDYHEVPTRLICLRRVRGKNAGVEAACSIYCFLGNVCSTVGAILSHQLALQVLLGVFMTVLDMINFVSILISLHLCWNSSVDRRIRMMKRRRRQNILAVSGLVLLGAGGSYMTSKILLMPIKQPIAGRTLLSYVLQDTSDVVGCVLGLLSFIIAWTSKFPALSRAHRGERPSKAEVSSGVLCSLAGVLYAAAILVYDTQLEFILRAVPWLLTATSSAALELLVSSCISNMQILTIYWCRRSRTPQPKLCSDTESLLGSCPPSTQISSGAKPGSKEHTKSDEVPLNGNSTKKIKIQEEHYVDVNFESGRKVCLKQVSLSRNGIPESQLLRTVRVVRIDESCTSDSSSASSLRSDMECDFEEASLWWKKTPKQKQGEKRFPLQEWPKSPLVRPPVSCPGNMAGLVRQKAPGTETKAD